MLFITSVAKTEDLDSTKGKRLVGKSKQHTLKCQSKCPLKMNKNVQFAKLAFLMKSWHSFVQRDFLSEAGVIHHFVLLPSHCRALSKDLHKGLPKKQAPFLRQKLPTKIKTHLGKF